MSKSNNWENSILLLLFNATAVANVADNAASAPLTNLYVSLHTGDPGEPGDQTTNEATYAGYARVPVARTGGAWVVTANSVSPASNVTFPEATGGAETITHFAIGSAASGAGVRYYSGTVTPNIGVTTGVTPILTTASTITED